MPSAPGEADAREVQVLHAERASDPPRLRWRPGAATLRRMVLVQLDVPKFHTPKFHTLDDTAHDILGVRD